MLVQFELLFSALILLSAFILLIQKRIVSMTYTFAWQSTFLSFATLLTAISLHQTDLYFSAAMTFVLKVIFIPYFLRYLIKNLRKGTAGRAGVSEEAMPLVARPFLLSLIGASLVLFSYHLVLPLRGFSVLLNNNVIGVALSVVFLGMLLIISHRKAISHAIGFMVMENGIFFAALVSTSGMPMVVELGVAFDVLVAVILFGVFFFQISSSIDSLDVDRLNKLREDIE